LTSFDDGGPESVVAADLDGDSDEDLAVVDVYSGDLVILRGGTGGTFGSPVNHGHAPGRSMTTADLNGDSDPDLLFWTIQDVSILLGSTGSRFSGPTTFNM